MSTLEVMLENRTRLAQMRGELIDLTMPFSTGDRVRLRTVHTMGIILQSDADKKWRVVWDDGSTGTAVDEDYMERAPFDDTLVDYLMAEPCEEHLGRHQSIVDYHSEKGAFRSCLPGTIADQRLLLFHADVCVFDGPLDDGVEVFRVGCDTNIYTHDLYKIHVRIGDILIRVGEHASVFR